MEAHTDIQSNTSPPGQEVVAFIDMGTNSIRLLLVRINPNHSYTILSKQKEVVRLGEGEFIDNTLQPAAMDRAVAVCQGFANLARSRQAEAILAVATSATREASNQAEFIHRLQAEAGLDVRVISGREEARLIYRGVSGGIHLGDETALFLDIGGGSTEVSVGDQQQYDYLETHPLGAIRLASTFTLPGETGPIKKSRYALIRHYVDNAIARTIQHIQEYTVDLLIGSSGTIENLAQVAYLQHYGRSLSRDASLRRVEVSETIQRLCELPLEERRKLPGINPERADIIIPGAAILEAFMEAANVDKLRVSDRGLEDGLLRDYLERNGQSGDLDRLSIRERSVFQLGRSLNFDEAHARQVACLAMELFDSARTAGLHDLSPWRRELLQAAALLHDIGAFITYENHHAHSHYLIRNVNLLGFDETEIEIIASTVYFHRKSLPTKKQKIFAAVDPRQQGAVQLLSLLLRLAESLDRSHAGNVREARFTHVDQDRAVLEIVSDKANQLELWGLENHRDAFRKTFGKTLEIVQKSP